MPIVVAEGTPIPTKFSVPGSLGNALPLPQISIQRSPQREDAWCYAACAEMVITICKPNPIVQQCAIAGFIKKTDCCQNTPTVCTSSGCQKNEIGKIFDKFGIDYEGSDPNHPTEVGPVLLAEILSEVSANPPRPVEAVIDWDVGGGQSSHAVVIVGVNGSSIYVIDPLRGINYNGWQPYDFVLRGFGQGHWVRTWLKLRKK